MSCAAAAASWLRKQPRKCAPCGTSEIDGALMRKLLQHGSSVALLAAAERPRSGPPSINVSTCSCDLDSVLHCPEGLAVDSPRQLPRASGERRRRHATACARRPAAAAAPASLVLAPVGNCMHPTETPNRHQTGNGLRLDAARLWGPLSSHQKLFGIPGAKHSIWQGAVAVFVSPFAAPTGTSCTSHGSTTGMLCSAPRRRPAGGGLGRVAAHSAPPPA